MMNRLIIAAFCTNSALLPQNACGPTTEAFSKQVGLYKDLDSAENVIKLEVQKRTPALIEQAVGYGVMAHKAYKGEEVRYGFKVSDFCDRLELGGSKTSGSLTVKWNF